MTSPPPSSYDSRTRSRSRSPTHPSYTDFNQHYEPQSQQPPYVDVDAQHPYFSNDQQPPTTQQAYQDSHAQPYTDAHSQLPPSASTQPPTTASSQYISNSAAGPPSDVYQFRLWVGNLALGIDRDRIQQEFGKFGTIRDIYISPANLKLNRPKGFAFISYSSAAEADSAQRTMNNAMLDGQVIGVNYSRPKLPQRPRYDDRGPYSFSRYGPPRPRYDDRAPYTPHYNSAPCFQRDRPPREDYYRRDEYYAPPPRGHYDDRDRYRERDYRRY